MKKSVRKPPAVTREVHAEWTTSTGTWHAELITYLDNKPWYRVTTSALTLAECASHLNEGCWRHETGIEDGQLILPDQGHFQITDWDSTVVP